VREHQRLDGVEVDPGMTPAAVKPDGVLGGDAHEVLGAGGPKVSQKAASSRGVVTPGASPASSTTTTWKRSTSKPASSLSSA
jgi:hypothetical protein